MDTISRDFNDITPLMRYFIDLRSDIYACLNITMPYIKLAKITLDNVKNYRG